MNFPKAFASAVVAVGLSTMPVNAQQIVVLQIVNNTGHSVTFLSLSPVVSTHVGINLFPHHGDAVLPGWTANFEFDLYGSCNFNIQYRVDNSSTGTTFQQDVCANPSFTVN